MAELNSTSLLVDANLKAYYRGENVNDSTANANTLTNVNSVAFTGGKFSNAFDFGSSNTTKYLQRTTDLGIAGNSNSSFSFWVKLQAEIASSTWTLLRHSSTSGADRYIEVYYDYNAGTRRLVVDVSGTTYTYTVTLGTSNYHHIVITKNVAGNSSHLWLDNTDVANGTLGSTTTGNNFIVLGAREVPSNYSSVFIDDVGCFDKVLNSTEISTLYTDTNSGSFLMFL